MRMRWKSQNHENGTIRLDNFELTYDLNYREKIILKK